MATAAREGGRGRSDFSCNLPLISHFVLENEYHSFIDPACLPSPVPSTLHGGSSMVAWPVSYRTRLSAFPPLPPPPLSPGPNVVSYDRRLSVWLEKWSSRSGRINPFSLRLRPWTTLNRIWQLTPQKKVSVTYRAR